MLLISNKNTKYTNNHFIINLFDNFYHEGSDGPYDGLLFCVSAYLVMSFLVLQSSFKLCRAALNPLSGCPSRELQRIGMSVNLDFIFCIGGDWLCDIGE